MMHVIAVLNFSDEYSTSTRKAPQLSRPNNISTGRHPNALVSTSVSRCCSCTFLCTLTFRYIDQFKLTCSPKVTSTNSPKNFSVPLPASYSSSYSRYLALSGYNAELKDKMFFKMFLGGKTNTAQTVVLIADASINMVILSI